MITCDECHSIVRGGPDSVMITDIETGEIRNYHNECLETMKEPTTFVERMRKAIAEIEFFQPTEDLKEKEDETRYWSW